MKYIVTVLPIDSTAAPQSVTVESRTAMGAAREAERLRGFAARVIVERADACPRLADLLARQP